MSKSKLSKRIFALALALVMLTALLPMAALAKEKTAASDGDTYVLMNIPYDKFYAAESSAAVVDAVSSATAKARGVLASGSYHDSEDKDIGDGKATTLGVVYWVKINRSDAAAQAWLATQKQVKDSDKLEITTTNRGQTSTQTYEGKETLFENPSYAYYMLADDTSPTSYKELTVADGSPRFGAATGNATKIDGASATISTGGHHADYEITISGADEVVKMENVAAAIIHTTENAAYGLHHVLEIWRGTELGFNAENYSALVNKTINKITYYLTDSTIRTVDGLSLKVLEDSKVTATVESVDAGTETTSFTLSGQLPNDFKAKFSVSDSLSGVSAVANGTSGVISSIPKDADFGAYTLTIEDQGGKYAPITAAFSLYGYVLMNIPYQAFYNTADVSNQEFDYDAISSATNKVGNYGKSGGAYHGEKKTTETAEDGTVTAVGGTNGAKNEGVIWPVQVSDKSVLTALGGTEIKDADEKTVATLGRGQTSSTKLYGYETLTEAPAYSYYILSAKPENYLTVTSNRGNTSFAAGKETATKKDGIAVDASYGTNWGDVQLSISEVDDANNALINAVVITARDGNSEEAKVGFVHLTNVWSATEMAWKVAQISGLDGKTITNIRYYCMVKDTDNSDEAAPAYANYIYDYPVSLKIMPVYTGTVTAAFDSSSSITLTGLPTDIKNPKAKVYHTTGGRDAVITYLTPLEVDPTDDDIDPVTVEIKDGKIELSPELVTVTNGKGESKAYGRPVNDAEYTIEISSDNWIINKITSTYAKSTGTGADAVINPFVDAAESGYYYDAVLWAYANGITSGTDDTHFGPDNGCTRAQFVTFLWRAAGSPEPAGTENPFSDVSRSAHGDYYDAILWTAEQGVSTGTGDGKFNPDAVVTRAQSVSFMFRYAQKAGIAAKTGTPSFDDVKNEGNLAAYYDAIGWAVANGITNGNSNTANTFGPMDTCNRGMMITFLHRLFTDATA